MKRSGCSRARSGSSGNGGGARFASLTSVVAGSPQEHDLELHDGRVHANGLNGCVERSPLMSPKALAPVSNRGRHRALSALRADFTRRGWAWHTTPGPASAGVHRYRYIVIVASETYSRHLIRMARRQAGLTQQALAKRAGTSQAAMSAYESGRRSPSVDTLCRILNAAGFEVRMRLATPDTHGPSRAIAEVLLPAEQVAQHREREQTRTARRRDNA